MKQSEDLGRHAPPAATAALGVDPLTRNSYTFVNGDPINLSDPSGHAQTELDGAYMPWRDNQRLLRRIDRARALGIPLDRGRPLSRPPPTCPPAPRTASSSPLRGLSTLH